MGDSAKTVTRWPSSPEFRLQIYRLVSIVLFAAFIVVGFTFLVVPIEVIRFFNVLSRPMGLPEAPAEGGGLYLILAVGYMYMVSFLAWRMIRDPLERLPAHLLIQAKAASSLLSFLYFFIVHSYFILLANGIVDGAIAAGLLLMRHRWKGLWP